MVGKVALPPNYAAVTCYYFACKKSELLADSSPLLVQAALEALCDERLNHNNKEQTDAGWTWPLVWCLPALPAAAAGYNQPLPWNFHPWGYMYYVAGPAFHTPLAIDFWQQVEEAVQRAVQAVLQTALGATTSQLPCPPPHLALVVLPDELRTTGGGPSSAAPLLAAATGATPKPRQMTASDSGLTDTSSGPATSSSSQFRQRLQLALPTEHLVSQ